LRPHGPALIQPADCAGLEILGELDPRLLRRVLAQCGIATFREGDTILQRGAVNNQLHFVLSGRVQVHFEIDIRSQPIEIGVGRMFGEMSVIDRLPISAFVTAAEPCRILLLPDAVFWSDVITAPGITHTVMRVLSGRVRQNAAALMQAMRDHIRHEALEWELRLARDIQLGMLRRRNPWFPDRRDVEIVAHTAPAKLVGGDFYDAFFLDPDHLVLAIGDVAGKGISAALFMVRALTLLRNAATGWVSLARTAESMNSALAADNEASMFLTMFMAVLDVRTGVLEYVNFGHVPPLIRTPDGAAEYHTVPSGVVLGLLEDAQGAAGRLLLAPGSMLLLYTDGVTEALNLDNRQFGANALPAVVAAAATRDTEAAVSLIVAAVADHAGAAEPADDITVLAATLVGGDAASHSLER
jgi:phosphoserine phosphatase RsbU/P